MAFKIAVVAKDTTKDVSNLDKYHEKEKTTPNRSHQASQYFS